MFFLDVCWRCVRVVFHSSKRYGQIWPSGKAMLGPCAASASVLCNAMGNLEKEEGEKIKFSKGLLQTYFSLSRDVHLCGTTFTVAKIKVL